jgi:hypothetical protein
MLEEILKSDVERMKDFLKVYQDPSSSIDDKYEALDGLQELTENLYNANDLHKINGLIPVVNALDDEDTEIQMRAGWILASLVTNNEAMQKLFAQLNVMDKVIGLLKKTNDAAVRSKLISTVSGFVKNFPAGLDLFKQHDGFSSLERVLETNETASKRKVLFLLGQLLLEGADLKSHLQPVIPLAVKQLTVDHVDIQEKALILLANLAQGHEENQKKIGEHADAIREYKKSAPTEHELLAEALDTLSKFI